MWCLLLIGIGIGLAFAAYQKLYCYWSRRGIEGPRPVPLFGNLFSFVVGRKHFSDVYTEIYKQYPTTKYVGVYKMSCPTLLIRDLDLVHNLMTRNYMCFEEMDFQVNKKNDPLVYQNPFLKVGQEWKDARTLITPILTISKVKNTFPTIKDSCEKLCLYMSTSVDKEFDVKQLFYKYVIENVASCAFGLDAGTFDDPNSEFLVNSQALFEPNFVKNLAVLFFPPLLHIMPVTFVSKRMDKWLRSIVNQVMKQRRASNAPRNDFLQAIMDHSRDGKELSEDVIVGNCLLFVSEGSETSAITLTYTFYELARNPEIQEKLYEELSNSELSLESLSDMKYLEQVVLESLRMHPTVPTFTRNCTSRLEIDGQYSESKQKLVVEPGTKIVIPVQDIHMDPENFEHPEIFDPSRFSKENMDHIKKMSYLAFGEGPRMCPGKFFGMFQVKAGITAIVKKYRVELSERSTGELKQSPTSFMLQSDSPIWLKFVPRK